jgi:hypothetical protein
VLRNSTGSKYGIWEADVSISPVLIVFLLMGLARALAALLYKKKNRFETSRIPALILLIFVSWFSVELTLAKGLLFSLTKDLPILSSLHVNVRFASIFIMPLVIYGAFSIERFFQRKPDIRIFAALGLLTLATLLPYFLFSSETHVRFFAISSDQDIQRGKRYGITEIAPLADSKAFINHASSYEPYEPLFGYKLQDFKPYTHPGSVFEKDGGYFNMTNPASLVFPHLNNLQPFERFKLSERDKLKLFVQRGQPGWQIPRMQRVLNYMSPATLVLCLIVLLINVWIKIQTKN